VYGSLQGNVLVGLGQIIDISSAILTKRVLRQGISATLLTHLSFIIGFLTIFPLALMFHSLPSMWETLTNAPPAAHLGVFFMAVLSGTVAYTLRNRAVKTIEVGEAALFTYLYPLWAAPLSVFWLGEQITTPFLVGAATVALGVAIAEYKRRR